ncbi:DUF6101 family protein [Chelatococcus asaccharovorans]|uniref:Uncharacterized protein n=1 Tax=Chelatococcus asaccharovorans TaxID=28210 RepID=A0A2V3UDK2_9HYPH|nr:DUF6101 family protein [Chelatococcus asaccharovorans]MBS7702277.1 hypothetical protein [Chelatococcus asaccharovorans]PXW56522.1 hypothetical protein C7450_108274 [Chelatococcus asaccharovorans]
MPGVPPHREGRSGDKGSIEPGAGKVTFPKSKPAKSKPAKLKPAATSWRRGASGKARGARPDAPWPYGLVFQPLADDAEDRFALIVVDGSRQDIVGLYDAADIVAQWQAQAKATGLPLLLPCGGARGDGYERLYENVGAVRLGAIIASRHQAVLARRRPRFLVRRKTTRMPERPIVWR